jgi:hypothetical protein
VVFSSDGRRLRSNDNLGQSILWDTEAGKRLDESSDGASFPEAKTSIDRARRILAMPQDHLIHLLKLDLDDDEVAYRRWVTRLRPDWHLEEAGRHEKEHQWFAAAFHLAQLLNAGPPPEDLLARLDRARAMIPELLPMPQVIKD